jgi:hypothetical protein
VECAFEILSNKWRIIQRHFIVSPDFAVDIVKACVLLHSFLRERDSYKNEDTMRVTGLENVPDGESVRGGGGGWLTANNVRNKVADYLLTDSVALLWQM